MIATLTEIPLNRKAQSVLFSFTWYPMQLGIFPGCSSRTHDCYLAPSSIFTHHLGILFASYQMDLEGVSHRERSWGNHTEHPRLEVRAKIFTHIWLTRTSHKTEKCRELIDIHEYSQSLPQESFWVLWKATALSISVIICCPLKLPIPCNSVKYAMN